MYQADQAADNARIMTQSGRDLPATFSDTFGAAWNEGRLFTQSVAGAKARGDVLNDYLAEIKQKTGKDLTQQFVPGGEGGGQTGVTDFIRANDEVAKMKQSYPDLDLDPLSDDEIEKRAIEKSRAVQTAYADMAGREKTFGGKVGMLAGGVASAATDPINLLALPIAPEMEGVGILAAALRWGAVGALAQTGIETAGLPYREEVQPGYSQSGESAANVAEAFLGGAALGGTTRALGNLWTRVKSGAWPTSIRDAGNIAESEANVANTNIYRGVEGEAAHRDALAKTIDDVVTGKPPDVSGIVSPDLAATADARFAPLMEARDAAAASLARAREAAPTGAAPELPFEQTAAATQAEEHLDVLADQIARRARESGYAMPKAEADAMAARLANAPSDQVAVELDRLQTNPTRAAEPLPKPDLEPQPPEPVQARPEINDAEQQTALRTGLDQARMTGDVMVHIGADEDGKPITQSLDSFLKDVDDDRAAAAHIEGCLNPPQQEAAE